MGDRLKMARSKAGLSLRALAQCVGVSPMAISKYERGLLVPGSAMLIKMANALSVKPDYFFRSNVITLSSPYYRRKKSLSVQSQNCHAGD